MFIGLVFSTHLLLNDSQQKQMEDRLVLFAATVPQSELIFPRIDLLKENERSFGKFPFQVISIKCRLRTKTVDHGLALLSAHS